SVIFLVSGNHKLASVAIFNHATSGEFGYAGAKSLLLLVLALMAMALIWLLDDPANNRARNLWREIQSLAERLRAVLARPEKA
ncbi:MAG TPA: hypothetical protein VM468_13115, partial [Mycoplana sp.]|nr:hypothetical protein [Mycoplana sp.]